MGAEADLRREAAGFLERASRSGGRWRLFWCAGAGVVATSTAALERETALVERFLAFLGEHVSGDPTVPRAGSVFFASSAGGIYAGSATVPPFDELTPVSPVADYGREKLVQEALFKEFAAAASVDLLIGRLSNLYGPGQNLAKPQGLISQVGRAALLREPVSIYVPLDTIRDYLFAADAGRMVAEAFAQLETSRPKERPAVLTTKIFASEVETTVASVLGAWRQALRRPLRIALASSPVGLRQPRVLSFRSRIGPDVRREPTLLTLGVDAVRRDQLARLLSAGIE